MVEDSRKIAQSDRFQLIGMLVVDVILFGFTAILMQAAEVAPWMIGMLLFVFCLFAPIQLAATAYIQGRMRFSGNN